MVPGLNAVLATIGSWDGTPIDSGTVTNLTVETINGRGYYNTERGDVWSDGLHWISSASIFSNPWGGSAINGGSITSQLGTTNNPGYATISAAASANSGWSFLSGGTALDISGRGPEFSSIQTITATNNVVWRSGFMDTSTTTEPSDAAYVRMENGWVYGVVSAAGSATLTTTSNQVSASSTQFRRVVTRCLPDGSGATFWLLTPTGPNTYTTNWTDTITASLPTGTSRVTGSGVLAYDTVGSAGKALINLDAVGLRFTEPLSR
jgi:hypothetical protein